MKYERPVYMQPGIPTGTAKSMFSGLEMTFPRFETPVTPIENFRLSAERKTPYWVPNGLVDFQSLMTQNVAIADPEKTGDLLVGCDFNRRATEKYTFNDWFNTNWTWEPSAGGAMLTPGTCLCEDITEWESVVKFPNIYDWDWKTKAEEFMKNEYDPTKVLHMNIGQGATERLISVVGGYTEGMLAMAMEPEAVRDFLMRFADFTIEYFDMLYELYPLNMVTYHDDWGTERDTFFSEKMMEEMVFEPSKKIVDHIKSKGVTFELHSCGNITRFIPYMIDMGVDFLQIQRRAVDIPAMKEKYGDRIGFDTGIENLQFGVPYSKEEMASLVDHTVDVYGKSGGYFTSIFGGKPEDIWNMTAELYYYSREYYDKERGE